MSSNQTITDHILAALQGQETMTAKEIAGYLGDDPIRIYQELMRMNRLGQLIVKSSPAGPKALSEKARSQSVRFSIRDYV